MKYQPVILLILDGWGIRHENSDWDPLKSDVLHENDEHRSYRGNAIIEARPDFYFHLLEKYPRIELDSSGEAVGLPDGQMGNSEVGHLNIGAGRVVYQELTKIDKAIRDGDFFKNEALLAGMRHARENSSTLHVMGLVSDGGVHSSLNHLVALLKMAKEQHVEKVLLHAFLDGRDVPPRSAECYLHIVEETLAELGYPQIATISGRYYAMDRDKRWDRTEQAYDNLTQATGRRYLYSEDALFAAYKLGEDDEFVKPSVSDITYKGMNDGDSIIFFNFRPDRARQLTKAFIDPGFSDFKRKRVLMNLSFVSMTMYDETFNIPIAFPKQTLEHILSEVLSENGIRQFRTAETEKYAHVTYFMNGGFEEPYPGEDRKLIPSPKVATYDLQPEMSLPAVSDAIVKALNSGKYQFIASNFANPDMIGHTGRMDAAIKAVKAVDEALKKVIETALSHQWVVFLTADHGNIETMLDKNGNPHTAHTTNPVPLILISNIPNLTLDHSRTYPISCIAPAILDIMGIPKPSEMTTASPLSCA